MADIIHNLSVGGTSRPLGTVHYIEGTGTTAGTWLGSDPSITEYYDGLTVAYKVNIAGASTTTLNINDLGAKTVRRNASKLTTNYPVNSVVHLTYTTIEDVGYWQCADYDSNSDYKASSYNTSSKIFLIGATSQTSSTKTGATTYSHDTAYVGTDGCLYSNKTKVSVVGHTHTIDTESKTSSGPSATVNVASTEHTHTVDSSGSYTPAGGVSQPTFSGTAVTSGGASATTSIYQITGVGSVPSLSAAIANNCMTFTWSAGSVPTRSSVVVAQAHTHSVTAAGTVSKPTFSGTAATISVSGTTAAPSGATTVSTSTHTHTTTVPKTTTAASTT